MRVRPEIRPFVLLAIVTGLIISFICWALGVKVYIIPGAVLAVVGVGFMIHFFRDPEMKIPEDPDAIVSGASGVVARIKEMREDKFLNCDTIRISIFLSPLDVHVNRAPIGGKSRFLGYFPGKHIVTYKEKSSDVNQHNSILIEGSTRCLVRQIVGPICRRVVYFLDHDNPTEVVKGERIGMMKFGSRLDVYFPAADIEVVAKLGEQVTAGESVIARLRGGK